MKFSFHFSNDPFLETVAPVVVGPGLVSIVDHMTLDSVIAEAFV